MLGDRDQMKCPDITLSKMNWKNCTFEGTWRKLQILSVQFLD